MAERGRERRQVRKVQRVAAYAVILRDDRILLSRLAKQLTAKELWTLPGGGLEHGEDPRDAVVREVHEETGLDAHIGETAHVYSFHQRDTWRQGRRADAHALRIVYDGWVPVDSPEPHVVEVDGSTMEAAWKPLAGVLDGTVPVVSLVTEVLAEHRPFRLQRVAAYALAVRPVPSGDEVLLARNSAAARTRASGRCPGGGIEHGEEPRDTVVREVREETGLDVHAGRRARRHLDALRGYRAVRSARGLPRARRSSSSRRCRRRRAADGRGGRRHHGPPARAGCRA